MGNNSTKDAAGDTPALSIAPAPNTVTLETPLKRGDQTITAVTLRKPASGELRGVALAGPAPGAQPGRRSSAWSAAASCTAAMIGP